MMERIESRRMVRLLNSLARLAEAVGAHITFGRYCVGWNATI